MVVEAGTAVFRDQFPRFTSNDFSRQRERGTCLSVSALFACVDLLEGFRGGVKGDEVVLKDLKGS